MTQGLCKTDKVLIDFQELETVSQYASNDETRYSLNSVFVDGNYMIATDGKSMARANHVVNPEGFKFMIPIDKVREIIRQYKGFKKFRRDSIENEELPIIITTFDDGSKIYSMQFPITGVILQWKDMDGVYPDWSRIYKEMKTGRDDRMVTLSKENLTKMLKSAKGKNVSITFKVDSPVKPVKVLFHNEDHNLIEAVLMPMSADDPEQEV